MRIGISVLTHEGQNIWENGLGQNVIFLAKLLQELPFVESVFLIDAGDQTAMPSQIDSQALGLRIAKIHDATDHVDVVIEMAGALDPQWLRLIRARGKKVVFHCCGQPYVGLIENAIFEKPGLSHPAERCDEIWLLPKDEEFSPLMRTLHRCPAYVAPYLWDSQFVEFRAKEVHRLTGLKFGYENIETNVEGELLSLSVAIFEPNISVVKTSTVSMLACEESYRVEPKSISKMHVLNTLHMTTHPTLLYLANSLDLVKHSRTVFHGRHDVVGFMVQHANAVVSHQWTNNQNYSYLDALYGNYPLVHNSTWLRDLAGAGYYYPEFNGAAGGKQLLLAYESHRAQLPDYKVRSQKVFDSVNPLNSSNLESYSALLLNLCKGTNFGVGS